MTEKELLYVEDALGHEKQMEKSCCDFSTQLQDADLKNFVSDLKQKHCDTFNKFYSLLNN